jgi:hypothetical protein
MNLPECSKPSREAGPGCEPSCSAFMVGAGAAPSRPRHIIQEPCFRNRFTMRALRASDRRRAVRRTVLSISILSQAHCRDDAAVHLGTARHRRRARRPRSLGESSRDRAGLQATHRGSRHDPERVYNRLRHCFGMDAKCRQLLGRQSFPHGYRQGHRASRKGSNRATPRRRGWCLSLLGWARRRTRGHDHALARMNRSREDTA